MTFWYIGFYAPIFVAIALVALAIVKREWRPACGAAALWGIGLGSAAFLVGFIGPILFTPGANQGPLLGFFVGPYGFLLGAVIGFVRRALRPPKNRESDEDRYLPEP